MNILRLLQIEYLKFKSNSVIRLLVILYLIFLPIAIFMGKELDELPDFILSADVFFTFPEKAGEQGIWDYMGYIGNWMSYFFLGVVAIYILGIEINNKTLRQSVINGLTRKEYFLSKLSTIVLISVLASLYYGLCTLGIGWIHTEGATLSQALTNEWAMSRYFLMCMGYLSFAFLIIVLFRRPAVSVFLYLSYVLIIEFGIRMTLIYFKVPPEWTKYFPMNVVEDLHPFPAFKIPAAKMGPDYIKEILLSYPESALVSSLYIIIFIALSYRMFMNRDI